jgi:hypothetical protein
MIPIKYLFPGMKLLKVPGLNKFTGINHWNDGEFGYNH